MSFGQEMERSIVLLVFLFLNIQSFDAFTLEKRHSPLFQPNPFWGYQDFDEKNDLRKQGSNGVKIREPIFRPLNKQDSVEQLEDLGMKTKGKNHGLVGVEIREPIVRTFNYQDSAEQDEDLEERISLLIRDHSF